MGAPHGAYKYWELERCLNEECCPLDSAPKSNLRFLIGLCHEIEHHKSAGTVIDSCYYPLILSATTSYPFYVYRRLG